MYFRRDPSQEGVVQACQASVHRQAVAPQPAIAQELIVTHASASFFLCATLTPPSPSRVFISHLQEFRCVQQGKCTCVCALQQNTIISFPLQKRETPHGHLAHVDGRKKASARLVDLNDLHLEHERGTAGNAAGKHYECVARATRRQTALTPKLGNP